MKAVIHTPITMRRDNGDVVKYGMGVKDIPEADARHWFARLHIEQDEKPKSRASVKDDEAK
jgi:hypothetical protein